METTPRTVLFDTIKRAGGISYKEIAALLLSNRPLANGRSAAEHALSSRTWASRMVVHATADAAQQNLFCSYDVGALRLMARLGSRSGAALDASDVLELVCGPAADEMVRALALVGGGALLFRNLVERLAGECGLTLEERAECAMVLFVATGCSGDARVGVSSALEFAKATCGRRPGPLSGGDAYGAEAVGDCEAEGADEGPTGNNAPSSRSVGRRLARVPRTMPTPWLGLLRMEGDYALGSPYWVAPTEEGAIIGSMALEEGSILDVDPDVDDRHARVWHDSTRGWLVEDLDSISGTVLERADGERVPLGQAPVRRRDLLQLGSRTTFLLAIGFPGGGGLTASDGPVAYPCSKNA